jgi:hypothetical protein
VLAHPVLSVFLVALAARLVVAVFIAVRFDGVLFIDDVTYLYLAEAGTEGQLGRSSYWSSAALLLPLSMLFAVFGPVPLIAQLFVGLLGAVTAAMVTLVALRALPAPFAALSGGIVALLPSQVLWSSVVLKDAVVWVLLAALAVLVSGLERPSRRTVGLVLLGTTVALTGLAYARRHTLAVACLALAITVVARMERGRAVAIATSLVLVTLVPAALGLGPAGVGVIQEAGDLETRRLRNMVDAESAIANPTELEEWYELREQEGGSGPRVPPYDRSPEPGGWVDDLLHLPRGLSVMLFEPVPWRSSDSLGFNLARIEGIVWYPVLLLAVTGLAPAWRHRRVFLFPVLVGGGVLLVYALTEGNIGTAYRHRGEYVWVVALLAGAGLHNIVERRQRQRS